MRSFDFNSVQQPMMQITLPDKEQTKIRLTMPKTSLAERMGTISTELKEISESKDESTIHRVYETVAEIMSCNLEFHTFTAEELKELLNFEHIAAFCLEYIKFLSDVKTAKN